MGLHLLDVGHALPADADVADDDAVIGPQHLARGRRGILAIDRRAQDIGAGDCGRGGGSRPDKCPARLIAGRWFWFVICHKRFCSISWTIQTPSLINSSRGSMRFS